MRTLAIVLAIGSASVGALAGAHQQPPIDSEVYLASWPGQGVAISAVTNISNDPEYDNQPSFTSDSRAVLFTSKRDGKQTDIYRYDIASKALTQLTHTPESEYSPLVTPDGKTFSVVRVEADGTQRLWRFDLDGSNPRLVLENVKPVGYHAWIDATHLALFVLGAQGQPATLQIADTMTGKAEIVATNIGRSSWREAGHVAAASDVREQIREAVAALGNQSRDARVRGDRAALRRQRGGYPPKTTRGIRRSIAASFWSRGERRSWRTLHPTIFNGCPCVAARRADLSTNGLTSITRLAVSPDAKWIAFVAQPAKSAIARRP